MFGLFARPKRREGGQSEKDYYDEAFAGAQHWRDHYTKSGYYFLWTVIVDRLRALKPTAILEIGCGPGQLASAIHDAGLAQKYTGIDFSGVALDFARKACPAHYVFVEADAVATDIYETAEYDTAITTEFLEHVEGDLDVLAKLRPGTKLLSTVPNFPYDSHVRHFENAEEVERRYGSLFRNFTVTTIPGVQTDTIFFLIQGEKT